jgi:hypothetical protein
MFYLERGDNMKKLISGIFTALLPILGFGLPVLALASYNLTFYVTESSGNSYSNLPMIISIDNTFYATHGYMTSNGLDTQVKDGSTMIPHLVADDKLAFVDDIDANSSKTLTFSSGNTPASSMPIITGQSGYVTTPYNSALEMTSDTINYSYSFYYDANATSGTLWNQGNTIGLINNGNGSITAQLNNGESSYTATANGVTTGLHTVDVTVSGGGGGGGENVIYSSDVGNDRNIRYIVSDGSYYYVSVDGTGDPQYTYAYSDGPPQPSVGWSANTTYQIGDTITAPAGYHWGGAYWAAGGSGSVTWTCAGGYAGAPFTSGANEPWWTSEGNSGYSVANFGGDLGWQWMEWDERVTWITPVVDAPSEPGYFGSAYIAKLDMTTLGEVDRYIPTEPCDYILLCYDSYDNYLFIQASGFGVQRLQPGTMTLTNWYNSIGEGAYFSYLLSGEDGYIYGCFGNYYPGGSGHALLVWKMSATISNTGYICNYNGLPDHYVPESMAINGSNLYVFCREYNGASTPFLVTIITSNMDESHSGSVSNIPYALDFYGNTFIESNGYLYLLGLDDNYDQRIYKLALAGYTVVSSINFGQSGAILAISANDSGEICADKYKADSPGHEVARIDPDGMEYIDSVEATEQTTENFDSYSIYKDQIIGFSRSGGDGVITYCILLPTSGSSSSITISVDGVSQDTENAVTVPDNSEDFTWSDDTYIAFISITSGDTEVLRYEPEDIIHGTDLPDLDGTQDGVITWGGVPEGLSFDIGPLTPNNPAKLVDAGSTGNGELLPSDSPFPPTMYTELDVSKLPGGDIINLLLDQGGVPRALFWFPFIFLGIAIIGMLSYKATTPVDGAEGSLFTEVLVIEVCLIFLGILGTAGNTSLIPLWPAFLFPIPGSAMIISRRHVGYG